MATIITGLFRSQDQAEQIKEDLIQNGFPESEFIIYLHEQPITKEVKTSIWQSFFNDSVTLEDESLVVSVKIQNAEAKSLVDSIFENNHVVHQNYIENIKFKDAQSLKFLKKIVALRAKSAIYSTPKVNYRGQSDGMNSEVFF